MVGFALEVSDLIALSLTRMETSMLELGHEAMRRSYSLGSIMVSWAVGKVQTQECAGGKLRFSK